MCTSKKKISRSVQNFLFPYVCVCVCVWILAPPVQLLLFFWPQCRGLQRKGSLRARCTSKTRFYWLLSIMLWWIKMYIKIDFNILTPPPCSPQSPENCHFGTRLPGLHWGTREPQEWTTLSRNRTPKSYRPSWVVTLLSSRYWCSRPPT